MKLQTITKVLAATLVVAMASHVSADVVETKSGARITGKVVKIDGGAVIVSTDYAGDVKIKQSEVVAITTESALNIRLTGGTVLQSTLSSSGAGAITLTGADGTLSSTVDKVATTWAPGETDPVVAALQRGWTYESAVDVTGKTGNKEQLGTSFSFRAVLAGSQDTLQFYSGYDRQVSDGAKSADQFKAGVDYANNFSGKYSWYTRDEGGFDRVKDIELYNVVAAGFGYDMIKTAKQTLTGRAGLGFRYEGYKNPKSEDVKSAGLDFGLNHRIDFDHASLVNRITYVPSFEDFANYRFYHESFLELPTTNPSWKVRLGVSNDYTSKPAKGVERLDTTYFTRLVLNWK